jgi:hypothetical protein
MPKPSVDNKTTTLLTFFIRLKLSDKLPSNNIIATHIDTNGARALPNIMLPSTSLNPCKKTSDNGPKIIPLSIRNKIEGILMYQDKYCESIEKNIINAAAKVMYPEVCENNSII